MNIQPEFHYSHLKAADTFSRGCSVEGKSRTGRMSRRGLRDEGPLEPGSRWGGGKGGEEKGRCEEEGKEKEKRWRREGVKRREGSEKEEERRRGEGIKVRRKEKLDLANINVVNK